MPETIGKSSARAASPMPCDAADELAHRRRLLRIAEIEVVGERERPRADRDEIAPGLGDRLLAALDRIGLAIALGDVGGEARGPWARRRAARPPRRRPGPATVLPRISESYCS